MGLIRKTLAVGTVGVVRPSSKKQRRAKATMKSAEATAKAAEAQATQAEHAMRLAEAQAQEERDFRYATDPAYRKFIDERDVAS